MSVCFIALKMVIENICIAHFSFILVMLMLLAYDIEQNPGPSNPRQAELSILHLNIRSIRNKIDYIKDNLLDFHSLCFSETHLDQQIMNDSLFLSDSFDEPYRKDRTNHGGGGGGGLLVYINSQLILARRRDLEIYCAESIWVEIKAKKM